MIWIIVICIKINIIFLIISDRGSYCIYNQNIEICVFKVATQSCTAGLGKMYFSTGRQKWQLVDYVRTQYSLYVLFLIILITRFPMKSTSCHFCQLVPKCPYLEILGLVGAEIRFYRSSCIRIWQSLLYLLVCHTYYCKPWCRIWYNFYAKISKSRGLNFANFARCVEPHTFFTRIFLWVPCFGERKRLKGLRTR